MSRITCIAIILAAFFCITTRTAFAANYDSQWGLGFGGTSYSSNNDATCSCGGVTQIASNTYKGSGTYYSGLYNPAKGLFGYAHFSDQTIQLTTGTNGIGDTKLSITNMNIGYKFSDVVLVVGNNTNNLTNGTSDTSRSVTTYGGGLADENLLFLLLAGSGTSRMSGFGATPDGNVAYFGMHFRLHVPLSGGFGMALALHIDQYKDENSVISQTNKMSTLEYGLSFHF